MDSVKQHLMMNDQRWDEASIKTHLDEMKAVFLDSLDR